MDNPETTRERRDILAKLTSLEDRERNERKELLRDHLAKFRAERRALAIECTTTYGEHDWIAMPANGINGRHFITGEWPMWCPWCGTHRPFGWTEKDCTNAA